MKAVYKIGGIGTVLAGSVETGTLKPVKGSSCQEAASFTSQIIVLKQADVIYNGYTSVLDCHTSCSAVKCPTKPTDVEAFSECPPLGRFVACNRHQTVAVGVTKSVEKKEYESGANKIKSDGKI
ncbi:hypothetical protein FEM48_Zijuj07G0061800 [Ziziphus jujuba var. spinosa]|uniref:GTP-eEF1A C-terminal domain-containing protein n=1 Tax=Ziziphus jujuba var. spinosa TaxID=714518 RepID=A0A978V2X9_ZIZJJ|nr:hypothetical protein FEM48_Zijuj07G0061800 [Ziziphus jujuba var. spinosa]